MADIFKAQEILKIAIAIEKNGLAFYDALAKASKNFPIAEAFVFLAKEEKKHQQAFEEILARIGDWQPDESYPGEYRLYLEGFASEALFVKDSIRHKAIKGIKSDSQAIDFAVGLEKDSIIFYLDLKDFVPQEEQGIVDEIIAQERRHLVKLTGLKKKV